MQQLDLYQLVTMHREKIGMGVGLSTLMRRLSMRSACRATELEMGFVRPSVIFMLLITLCFCQEGKY